MFASLRAGMPGRHHATLTGAGSVMDCRCHSSQQHVAVTVLVDRKIPRAIEGGPYEFGLDPAGGIGQGWLRYPGGGNTLRFLQRSGKNPQPVSRRAGGAANKTGRIEMLLESGITLGRLLGLFEGRSERDVEFDRDAVAFRHQFGSVEQADPLVVEDLCIERDLQGRRATKGYLGAAFQQTGNQTADVSAVA